MSAHVKPLSWTTVVAIAMGVGIVALCGVSLPSLAAGSADAAFTVANYPVEARAKDAVTAKNSALADGQQAALRSLLRRLVPVTSYKRLKSIPPIKAADVIDGVSVKEERNSSTDYIATLDFSFQPAASSNETATVKAAVPAPATFSRTPSSK